jgi:glycosyltransferase involved in cell wall biosynthesis
MQRMIAAPEVEQTDVVETPELVAVGHSRRTNLEEGQLEERRPPPEPRRERRLRVAVVSYEFPEFCVALASGLASQAEVRAFLPEDSVGPFLRDLDRAVQLVTFSKPRLRQPYRQVRVARELLRQIDDYRPDVVHVQQGHMWFNFVMSRLHRQALVLTIHDPIAHLGDVPSQKTPRAVWHHGFRQADHFIVHTEHVRKWVVRELGIPPTAVHTVPLVAFEGEPETLPALEPHPPTILFFGRIWPYKGLIHLVRAEPMISQAVPDVEIVIAGEGENLEPYRAAMTNPDRFVVHNRYIGRNELAGLLGRADVVVLPYVDATQSGVVALAYAYSKPVVATTVGGLPEMVEHGITGLLVPPRDEPALADAVVQLLHDATLRQRMGAAGRVLARERWSPDAVAAQTMAVYRAAVADKGRSRP